MDRNHTSDCWQTSKQHQQSSSGGEWSDGGPPESVAVVAMSTAAEDLGYQSSGAMSNDGGNNSILSASALQEYGYHSYCYSSSSSLYHNSNAAAASSSAAMTTTKSSGGGSVCSQGSSGGAAAYFRHQAARDVFHNVMNGETRFPTAFSYAASETAKSDIATVCSGSVAEDIEVASVLSADYNNVLPQIPNNLLSSSPAASAMSSRNRRTASGGRVEFAALPIYASSSSPGFPSTTSAASAPFSTSRQSTLSHQDESAMLSVQVHDMGPPLSRALLLQQQEHPSGGPGSSCASNCSRPDSVRSFASTTGAACNSDVAAHVDTDDCAGSFTDGGRSIQSQEDAADDGTIKVDQDEDATKADDWDDTEVDDTIDSRGTLRNREVTNDDPNGRVSPGGTVYKGRGVRRYQGRYMNLPLKRFHQNGVSLCEDGTNRATNGFSPTGYNVSINTQPCDRREYNTRGRQGGWSPRHRYSGGKQTRLSADLYTNGNRNYRRRRSRSRSPPRSRTPPPHSRRDRRSSRSHRSRSKSPDRYSRAHRSRGDRYSSRVRSKRKDSPPSRYRRRHRSGK